MQLAKQYVATLRRMSGSPEIEKTKDVFKKALAQVQAEALQIDAQGVTKNILNNLSQKITAGSAILKLIITLVQCGCWSGIYVTQFLAKVIEFLER